jgi:hypothetical protein
MHGNGTYARDSARRHERWPQWSNNIQFSDPDRLRKMKVGYVNFYVRRDGSGYWGKVHKTRRAADNVAKYATRADRRVIARLVVRWK